MTTRELKILSKRLNPKIAREAQKLETEIDNYCIKTLKYKSGEYKIMKEVVKTVIIENMPRMLREGMAKAIEKIKDGSFPKHKNVL